MVCELYNDSFQNWKSHQIEKAQLILTDLPYQLGANAYGSSPVWYNGGDNKNGESKFAGKAFFDTDSAEKEERKQKQLEMFKEV